MIEAEGHGRSPGVFDPVFLHSRREALIIFLVWVVALAWAVPYCYLEGYAPIAEGELQTIWGIPAWVFWGIGVPWLVADLFTVWFCLSHMADDDVKQGGGDDASSAIGSATERVV